MSDHLLQSQRDHLFAILSHVEHVLHGERWRWANEDDFRAALEDIGLIAAQAVVELLPEPELPTLEELLENAAEELAGYLAPETRSDARIDGTRFFIAAARAVKGVSS